MKILIVGLGSIGMRHMKNLLKIKNTKIIVLTKRTDIKIKNPKCVFYESFEKCLDEKPDVALVCNVTNKHTKTALKLAEKKIHLFIEKPLSNSLNDIELLKSICKKNKLITMVGCNLRFHKCIKKIKDIIDSQKLGKPISIQVESGSYLPEWHPDENYKKSYASRTDLGGGVILTCIHELDYLYWFLGRIDEIFSFSGTISNLGITSEDHASFIMKFSSGQIGELHLDYYQKPDFRKCKIIFVGATIYWNSNNNSVKLYNFKTNKWKTLLKLKNYDRNQMYFEEIKYFLKCVESKISTINPIDSGQEVLKTALIAKQSSRKKRMLKIK